MLNKSCETSEKIINELHVKASRSRTLITKRCVKTTQLTPTAVSQRRHRCTRQSASSLDISKETLEALKRWLP
ncbi:MAG: hypothetical protein PUF84_07950 [Ruminococcus bromii]|nr:hypothetical protein [Ruminococcus bromii]